MLGPCYPWFLKKIKNFTNFFTIKKIEDPLGIRLWLCQCHQNKKFLSFEEAFVSISWKSKYVFISDSHQYKQWQEIFYLLLTSKQKIRKKYGSPQVGLEPTTNRLTADRSTTELLRNNVESSISYTFKDSCSLNRAKMQETQIFFWNFGNFAYYPLFYRKKLTIAIPFASPESVSERKGGGQPSPWSSPLSLLRCILINWFPRCCNFAIC